MSKEEKNEKEETSTAITTILPSGVSLIPSSWEMSNISTQITMLVKAKMIPAKITGTEEQQIAGACSIALMGRELGFPVMTSLRLIDYYKDYKMSALNNQGKLSLIYSRCPDARINPTKMTNEECVIEAKRFKDQAFQTYKYTIEEAKLEGLLGKDNWKRMPKRMLKARCISDIVNTIFSDVVQGMYSPEDVESIPLTMDISIKPNASIPQFKKDAISVNAEPEKIEETTVKTEKNTVSPSLFDNSFDIPDIESPTKVVTPPSTNEKAIKASEELFDQFMGDDELTIPKIEPKEEKKKKSSKKKEEPVIVEEDVDPNVISQYQFPTVLGKELNNKNEDYPLVIMTKIMGDWISVNKYDSKVFWLGNGAKGEWKGMQSYLDQHKNFIWSASFAKGLAEFIDSEKIDFDLSGFGEQYNQKLANAAVKIVKAKEGQLDVASYYKQVLADLNGTPDNLVWVKKFVEMNKIW